MVLAFTLFILMYSIILHEISHGVAAYAFGDPTAKQMKRLTLNPIPHVDIIGTVVLPAVLLVTQSPVLFGWAKPVPFDPRYFGKNYKLGVFVVSIAGIVTNLLLASFFAFLIRMRAGGEEWLSVLAYGFSINLILAIFNMLPIPPLDGSKTLGIFLPQSVQRWYFSLDRFGFVILFVLLYFGLLRHVIQPPFEKLASWFLGR